MKITKSKAVRFLFVAVVVGITVGSAGCRMTTSPGFLSDPVISNNKHHQNTVNINVELAQNGTWFPMEMNEVEKAIRNSITKNALFQEIVDNKLGADYVLNVEIVKFIDPGTFSLSGSFTAVVEAVWTLTDNKNVKVVMQQTIKSPYTEWSLGDAGDKVTRARMGAVRDNIHLGLTAISELKLNSIVKDDAKPVSNEKIAIAAPAHQVIADYKNYILSRTLGTIAQTVDLFPAARSKGEISIEQVYSNSNNDSYRQTVTIWNHEGICVHDFNNGRQDFYFGAGVLVAGSNQSLDQVSERATKWVHGFKGSISSLADGQHLVASISEKEMMGMPIAPGETRVTVMRTQNSWPEFNFPYPATQLKVVRDYETSGGYITVDEIALYSSEVGCAIPVTKNGVVINGNLLFGEKSKSSVKTLSYKLVQLH